MGCGSSWGKGKVQNLLVKWEGHQEWTWETRANLCTMCVTPGAATMPTMALRFHCDLLSPFATIRSVHSLHVAYFDYKSPTLTTCGKHKNLKCMLAPMTHLGPLRGFAALTCRVEVYLGPFWVVGLSTMLGLA